MTKLGFTRSVTEGYIIGATGDTAIRGCSMLNCEINREEFCYLC